MSEVTPQSDVESASGRRLNLQDVLELRHPRDADAHDAEAVDVARLDLFPDVGRIPLLAEERVLVGQRVAVGRVDAVVAVAARVRAAIRLGHVAGFPVLVLVAERVDAPADQAGKDQADHERDTSAHRGVVERTQELVGQDGQDDRDDCQHDNQKSEHGYLSSNITRCCVLY